MYNSCDYSNWIMVCSQRSIHRAVHHVPRLWIGVALSMRMFSSYTIQGRIQDFKLGGGAHLKKIAPSGGRRENILGITCEKSRFYAKKSYFFQLRGGGGAGCAPPPPWIRPCNRKPEHGQY